MDESEENVEILRTYFFDASAIVKIFVSEPGSKTVLRVYEDSGRIYTSWVLVAEALGVLKRKWTSKAITDREYGGAVAWLFSLLGEGRLHAVDVGLDDLGKPSLLTYDYDVVVTRQRYPHLDVADALQFTAIQQGVFKYLAGESKPQLVTADGDLAKAAEKEGIRVLLVNEDL